MPIRDKCLFPAKYIKTCEIPLVRLHTDYQSDYKLGRVQAKLSLSQASPKKRLTFHLSTLR